MIVGIFHSGSGLGNMLHRYVATRVLAADLGVPFGMDNIGNFKGADFMNLEMGKFPQWLSGVWNEERIENEHHVDIRPYDEKIKLVKPNTKIDGEFQDERYFEHRIDEVREWLKVEPLEMPDDVCVINFRGGEYCGVPDLFLPQSYWDEAIDKMKEIKDMKFVVHTDDPQTAQRFFPEFEIVHDMALNWRSIRYAKYLILSNSSFAILPALLNEDVKKIYAPKYWAGYNVGYWKLPQNQYKKFTYI